MVTIIRQEQVVMSSQHGIPLETFIVTVALTAERLQHIGLVILAEKDSESCQDVQDFPKKNKKNLSLKNMGASVSFILKIWMEKSFK